MTELELELGSFALQLSDLSCVVGLRPLGSPPPSHFGGLVEKVGQGRHRNTTP